jgi:hypothetical protein
MSRASPSKTCAPSPPPAIQGTPASAGRKSAFHDQPNEPPYRL